jgi:hypothetical protein
LRQWQRLEGKPIASTLRALSSRRACHPEVGRIGFKAVKTRHSFCDAEYGRDFAMSIGAIDNNVKDSLGCTFKGSRDDLSQ